jgi:transcriptional regulator with XRE-family HTH domain
MEVSAEKSSALAVLDSCSSTQEAFAEIGAAIRLLRLEAGLSQEELALKAKITSAEVSRLENGKRNPKWETMERLADALGVPTWWLVHVKETLKGLRRPPR